MTLSRTVFLFLALFTALAKPTSAQSGLPRATPEMFGSLPNVAEVQISPNGRHLALLENMSDGASVVIYDLNDRSVPPAGIRVGSAKARRLEWADDDHILVLTSITKTINVSGGKRTAEFARWVAFSRQRRSTRILMPSDNGRYITGAGQLVSTLPAEPGVALFFADRGDASGLFAVNLDTGAERLRFRNKDTSYDARFTTIDWIVNQKGDPVARIDVRSADREVRILHTPDSGKTFDLVKTFETEVLEPWPLSVAKLIDGDTIAAATVSGRGDTDAAVEFDLETGAIGETLFQHSLYDVDGFGYEPRTAQSTYVQYTDDMPQRLYFDAAVAALQKSLSAAMPGATPLIDSRSANGARSVVKAIFVDRPAEFYLHDASTGRLSRVAPSYRDLDGLLYSKREKYDYAASDGLAIRGYLTVPLGAERKDMPLIVLPHGGPGARDDMSFDWWAGSYAARGYLVYQPNFRGSTGFGQKFYDAGAGQWGRKMQDDISEGVRKLVSDGLVDARRICIVGASYGGYAALAGMSLTPELYACGVSVAGISDLPAMLASGSRDGGGAERFLESRIGATRFRNTDQLNAVSPAKQVKSVRAPILLIHGRDDTVVPFSQSLRMRDAMKSAGKTVEFAELKGEDHWLSIGATRTEMLARSIAFIDKHIGAPQ